MQNSDLDMTPILSEFTVVGCEKLQNMLHMKIFQVLCAQLDYFLTCRLLTIY
jgi:hypothetical protein